MEYWRGQMDWPLNKDWKCKFCNGISLTWGLPHAMCRCNNCHVQYTMRDKDDKVVNIPICLVKSEYIQAYKNIFKKTSKLIDEVTDTEWDEFGVREKKELNGEIK